MKRFILVATLALIGSLCSPAFADIAPASDLKEDIANVTKQVVVNEAKKAVVPKSQTTDEAKLNALNARLADALDITQKRLANMTPDEKEKLIDDLNHPDGKTIGQGMASFGKELGQGLGSAVKEVGTGFNDFASSGVGKIATVILAWHFFGRSILWFIFICMLLKGVGKTLKQLFGEYTEQGKFVKLNLTVTRNMGDGTVFGIYSLLAGVLAICALGAAVNF